MRPLTIDLTTWLTGAQGQEGIAFAMTLPADERHALQTLSELRRQYTDDEAAALLDQARLRTKARAKFGAAADRMLFTDEALQQASGAAIATYRSGRYARFGGVADLGCGIGGDAIALSHAVPRLLAIDLDPVRIILARFNLAAAGGSADVTVREADWTRVRFPHDIDAAFADPARRIEERRVFSLSEMLPPIDAIHEARASLPQMGVKVMPGVADEEIPAGCEAEWISEGGVCKEGVLWFGDLRPGAARSATLVAGDLIHALRSTDPPAPANVTAPRAYLYEPDAAVIRATLVLQAAAPLGATQIDPQIAYLTGDSPALSPFVRGWPVLAHGPFNLKGINRMLREQDARVLAVKKRGSPIEPETFRKRLKSNPRGQPTTLFVTRHRDQPYVILCGEELRAAV